MSQKINTSEQREIVETSQFADEIISQKNLSSEFKGVKLCGFLLRKKNVENANNGYVYLWMGNLNEKEQIFDKEFCENHETDGFSIRGSKEELLFGFYHPTEAENDSITGDAINEEDYRFIGVINSYSNGEVSVSFNDFTVEESSGAFGILKNHKGICATENIDELMKD